MTQDFRDEWRKSITGSCEIAMRMAMLTPTVHENREWNVLRFGELAELELQEAAFARGFIPLG